MKRSTDLCSRGKTKKTQWSLCVKCRRTSSRDSLLEHYHRNVTSISALIRSSSPLQSQPLSTRLINLRRSRSTKRRTAARLAHRRFFVAHQRPIRTKFHSRCFDIGNNDVFSCLLERPYQPSNTDNTSSAVHRFRRNRREGLESRVIRIERLSFIRVEKEEEKCLENSSFQEANQFG